MLFVLQVQGAAPLCCLTPPSLGQLQKEIDNDATDIFVYCIFLICASRCLVGVYRDTHAMVSTQSQKAVLRGGSFSPFCGFQRVNLALQVFAASIFICAEPSRWPVVL